MRNRKSKIFLVLLVSLSLVGAAVAGAYADTVAEKRQQAEEARQLAEEATDEAQKLYLEGIAKLSEIEANEAKIEETKKQLEAKEAEIKKQREDLSNRLSVMYKTGTVGFVDVILNSNNITELIQNMGVVQKILQNDKKLLAQLKDDLAEIDKLKQEQEEELQELEKQKEEIEQMRQEYLAKAEEYEAQEAQLNAEAEELGRAAAQSEYTYSGSVVSGGVCFPVSGAYLYTDYFGWRSDPFTGATVYHSGYDICLYGGSYGKPCYAVKDGVIALARVYSNFGNCVMLDVGDGYQVCYAHLSDYAVYEGQTVSCGDVIGYIGSTGYSTGPHLHIGAYYYGSLVDAAIIVPQLGY